MGSVSENLSPPAYGRIEQLGVIEGSEDWVGLPGAVRRRDGGPQQCGGS